MPTPAPPNRPILPPRWVHDLDARLERLHVHVLLGELRREAVDGAELIDVDRTGLLHGELDDAIRRLRVGGVILNGTSVITLTIPVPTKDMDGCLLTIVGNGAAAHILTFTGGLSGAGASYDVVTVNATAPIAMQAMACNGLWMSFTAVPIAGTVTNITGTVA